MRFAILGPVKVFGDDGGEATLDGSKQRTVLTALLLARGGLVSDDRLSSLLWGWHPPSTINAQIYTYISRLRKYLGPSVEIVRQRPGYCMRIGGARFDYDEFERLSGQGQADLRGGRFEAAADHFRQALALWRGPALADVTEYLADAELPHLEEARMLTLEGRIEAELALGRHRPLVTELSALVTEHPMRERLRAQLMTTLYRCDRQAEALAVYQEGRRILAEELGVDPGATLNAVHHAILTGDLDRGRADGGGRDPVSAVWADTGPAMLPPRTVDFTGRATEVSQLTAALRPPAAGAATLPAPILITGAAGVGKTALGVHVAHLVRRDFPDGELYVDLDGMGPHPKNPFEVLGWFLRALGVHELAIPCSLDERIQLYRSQLARQRTLVVLDDAASEVQVRPLLPSGPGCRVILTSRTRLSAPPGAQVTRLEPMAADEALGLLRTIVGPQRVATELRPAQRIVELCAGLPLAVRIAGVRIAAKPTWSFDRFAVRLADRSRRLDELRCGELDVRTSLHLSYERLDELSRQAFRQMALLDIPDFPAWAAAAMLGRPERRVEEILETLVDAQLLEVGLVYQGRPRYRFQPLVAVFAREQAFREDNRERRRTAVDRGLDAWLGRALKARKLLSVPGLVGPGVGWRGVNAESIAAETARNWFEGERDVLVGLLHQASATGRHQAAWDLADVLRSFFDVTGLTEGTIGRPAPSWSEPGRPARAG